MSFLNKLVIPASVNIYISTPGRIVHVVSTRVFVNCKRRISSLHNGSVTSELGDLLNVPFTDHCAPGIDTALFGKLQEIRAVH